MTVGTAKQLTAVLDAWVAAGIKEDPAHSNRTPIGEEFGWNGVAWCCETMSVAQTRIGLHCFHEAAVVNAVAAAKRGANGLQWVPANGVIAEGDMSCFQWADGSHHISYVRDPGTQVKFQTDSGNENDRMFQQWRDRKYVMGFIRLPYAASPPLPTPPPAHPQEEDVLRIVQCREHPTTGEFVTDCVSQVRTLSPQALEHGRNLGLYPKDTIHVPHDWLVWVDQNQDGHNNPDGV